MSSFSLPCRRDIVELSVGYVLILAAVWTPLHVQRILFWIAFAWIVSTVLLRRDDRDTLGLGLSGLRGSLWLVGVAFALATVDLLISLWYSALHPLYGPLPVVRHMWGYMIWALMQQFVLQDFFLLRLVRVLPSRRGAVILAATLFAIAHIPNPLLTIVTLLWGLAACVIFLKYRNLYILGLVHGVLGLCIAVSVPNAVHHHMRVGLGYVLYQADYPSHHAGVAHDGASPGGTQSSTALRAP